MDISVISERLLLGVLERIPVERINAFRNELRTYATVLGDADGHVILVDWATVRRRTDERAVALKVLDFLTKELTAQLAAQRCEGGQPRPDEPTVDTVLHESGVRHDPHACAHCRSMRRSATVVETNRQIYAVGTSPEQAIRNLARERHWGRVDMGADLAGSEYPDLTWGRHFTADGTSFKAAGCFVPGGAVVLWWK